MKFSSLLLLLCFFMFSCSNKNISFYENNSPKLDFRQFLQGKTKAWGALENRKGQITRRFVVDMETTWNGNEGTLKEHFTFDDGEKSERTWHIKYNDDNTFTATAGDVIGVAKGKQAGNAINLEYVLDLKVGSKRYNVSMEEWLYQIDDKTIINKSDIKKFGITFAKLTLFIQKQ